MKYIEITRKITFTQKIACLDPETTIDILTDEYRSRKITTKVNYASILRDFWLYTAQLGVNGLTKDVSPRLAIYWMRARCRRIGNCNSESSWSAALSWQITSLGGTPLYYTDKYYRKAHGNMVKLWTTPRKLRKPIQLKWLIAYARSLGVTPDTWWTCPLEHLTTIFMLVLLFFSMSRPAEMLYTNSTENPDWETIITGLKWSNIEPKNSHKNYKRRYLKILIRWFKNQEYRCEPKWIFMGTPSCSKPHCKCHILNYYEMFFVIKQRRCQEYKLLQNLNSQNMNVQQKRLHKKRIANLGTQPHDYIFVGKNGSVWKPYQLTGIISNMIETLNIPDPTAYSNYSIRIGATSLAYQQRIDLLKMVRYVIWSTKALPHVSARYINFTIPELRIIPFEMIHGANNKGQKCIDNSYQPLKTFDLTNQKIKAALFKA